MNNKQKANAYAIAKTLGYGNSVEDFIKEYSQYYDEAYKKTSIRTPRKQSICSKIFQS